MKRIALGFMLVIVTAACGTKNPAAPRTTTPNAPVRDGGGYMGSGDRVGP
jgi:hypothetical protein